MSKQHLMKLNKLAAEGDQNAQIELAQRLATGDGVEKDVDRAFDWYSKAAASGSPDAAYHLGLMYVFGEGVAANCQRAVELFQYAARLGSDDAHFILADAYVEGKLGLPIDVLAGTKHYLDACQCGGAIRSIPSIGGLVRDGRLEAGALIALMCQYGSSPLSCGPDSGPAFPVQ